MQTKRQLARTYTPTQCADGTNEFQDYGKAYRYAHDEPEAYAAGENYFPEGMAGSRYYCPVGRGLELKIAEKLRHLRDLDQKSSK